MESDKNNDRRTAQDIRQPNKPSQPQNLNLSAEALAKAESSSHIMPAFEDILKDKTIESHPLVAGAAEKEFISQMVEKISHTQQQDRSGEIPSLDLGQQILAQQRKIAALKRKSPGQETKPQPAQIKSIPPAPASPQHLIIADIVAKEIIVLTSAR